MELIDKVIILKTADHKEKNKTLTVFGLKNGLNNLLARGIKEKNAKLKFLGLPFVFCEVELLSAGGAVIKTATLIESFSNISKSIEKYESACFCTQAILILGQKDEEGGLLFKLFLEALMKINSDEDGFEWQHAVSFVLTALSGSGYKMIFEACVACGDGALSPAFLNFVSGELLCRNCASNGATQVKASTVETFKKIERGAFNDISAESLGSARKFLNQVFISIFDRKLI